MGNTPTTSEGNPQFQSFTASLEHLRKDFIPIIGKEVEIYRPFKRAQEEARVLMIEFMYLNASPSGRNEQLDRLRQALELRKEINIVSLGNLVWVNQKQQNSMCGSNTTLQLAFEHSDLSIAKLISDVKVSRGSIIKPGGVVASPQKVGGLLRQVSLALRTLGAHNQVHGFVSPASILVLDAAKDRPIYKLIDVSLLGNYPKFDNQRV